MTSLTETASIVCDDIRVEVGQKVSLMGVYGSTIKAQGKEAFLNRLCLFKHLSSDSSIGYRAELDLLGPNGSTVLPKGERPEISDVTIGGDTNIGLGVGPLRLTSPGTYTFVLILTPKEGPPHRLEHRFTLALTDDQRRLTTE